MINIAKQITYWQNGAFEDLSVAQGLVDQGKIRHGLFFAHLSLEKMLKANVCKTTQAFAPRIHNLVRLSELARLNLLEAQIDLLAEVNEFNIEGRYPELLLPPPSQSEADEYVQRINEVLQCLNSQL